MKKRAVGFPAAFFYQGGLQSGQGRGSMREIRESVPAPCRADKFGGVMSKKPFIFFCDDKPKWTGLFKYRHGGKVTCEEIREVKKVLEKELDTITDADERRQRNEELNNIDVFLQNNTAQYWEDPDKNFDVETINSYDLFEPTLTKLIKEKKKKPDIILVDLYHPWSGVSMASRIDREVKGEQAIETLKEAIEKAKDDIVFAWCPKGFSC